VIRYDQTWKKGKLNCEKTWEIGKKTKLNIEKMENAEGK
jgi:hypothetical protein